MKYIAIILLFILIACSKSPLVAANRYQVVEWEHGLKTSRVIATHYKSPMGYNIKLEFPLVQDQNNADREEVSDWLEVKGCNIFEGGGYLGAPAYMMCDGVKDAPTANAKLRAILPGLSAVMFDLANNIPVKVIKPKPKYEWPKEDPKQCDRHTFSGMSGTGWQMPDGHIATQFKLVSEPDCHWVEDVDGEQSLAKWEARRWEIWNLLSTRALTKAEIEEAKNYGDLLNVQNDMPFDANQKKAELSEAWEKQAILQSERNGP